MDRVLVIKCKGQLLFRKKVGKSPPPRPPRPPRYAVNGFSFGELDKREFIELMTDRSIDERWAWRERWRQYHPLHYPPLGLVPNLDKEPKKR